MNIRESELPGIGCKFEVITQKNEKAVIVIHNDGKREIYHFSEDHEESISNITFNDSEARKVAAILGGMVYKPQALETLEMAFEGLTIEWFKVEPNAPAASKTIGSLSVRETYHVTIVAILKKNMKKLYNPGPDSVIDVGDMLVLSGERPQVKRMIKELLSSI